MSIYEINHEKPAANIEISLKNIEKANISCIFS